MAAATVGLMYEDVAHALEELPPPHRVGDEDVDPERYRRVVARRAAPFVRRAQDAYRHCEQTATYPGGLRALGEFCTARRARLHLASRVSSAPTETARSGHTVVEVLRH